MSQETKARIPIPMILYLLTVIILAIIFTLDLFVLKIYLPYFWIALAYAVIGLSVSLIKPSWFTVTITQ